MDKRIEELLEEAGKKFAVNIRTRAEEFLEMDRKKELTIDIIESIRHETRADSDRVIAELTNALTGTVCEKELIVKKTGNDSAVGNTP
jgi:tRNA1(Val) A37 N6-methylase TrmN6